MKVGTCFSVPYSNIYWKLISKNKKDSWVIGDYKPYYKENNKPAGPVYYNISITRILNRSEHNLSIYYPKTKFNLLLSQIKEIYNEIWNLFCNRK